MIMLLCLNYAFMGALLLALPNFTRRELLFGVPLPRDLRGGPLARRALSSYRAIMAVAIAVCVALVAIAPRSFLEPAAVFGPLVLLTAGAGAYYTRQRLLLPFAADLQRPRQAELSDAPDRLPGWIWLAIVPFLAFAAAALYLQFHWSRIPASFPVHWGLDGRPDRLIPRSARGVFGSLFFAAMLCLYLVFAALATWFGARRSHFRASILAVLIAVEWVMGALFCLIALKPILDVPVWIFAGLPLACVIPILLVIKNRIADSPEPAECTPNECWKWGGTIYYNPNDAALFVERRVGIGYTVNFAHPLGWFLMLGLIPVFASAAIFF